MSRIDQRPSTLEDAMEGPSELDCHQAQRLGFAWYLHTLRCGVDRDPLSGFLGAKGC